MGDLCAWLSRLLLLVIAVELITMPVTQQLWTFDGFLHGGEDFELGLFMIVVCICLALLRAEHGRQGVGLLLTVRQWLVGMMGGWQRWMQSSPGMAPCHAGYSQDRTPTPLLI